MKLSVLLSWDVTCLHHISGPSRHQGATTTQHQPQLHQYTEPFTADGRDDAVAHGEGHMSDRSQGS